MRRFPLGSHLKCFTTLVTYTSLRSIPTLSSALSRIRPAGPTNGFPAISSSLPGCSPIKNNRAFEGPSPKTVCVPRFHKWQAWHSAAILRSWFRPALGGIREAADCSARNLPAGAMIGELQFRGQGWTPRAILATCYARSLRDPVLSRGKPFGGLPITRERVMARSYRDPRKCVHLLLPAPVAQYRPVFPKKGICLWKWHSGNNSALPSHVVLGLAARIGPDHFQAGIVT